MIKPAGTRANVLVGIAPRSNSALMEEPVWHSSGDPALVEGLAFINETARVMGRERLRLLLGEDWPRFFQLQAAYLLLWSVIERHASLAYGPSLSARKKAEKLGADQRFREAVRRHLAGVDLDPVIYDVADLREIELASEPLEYLRQIRHNITHRGKAALSDGERVRLALGALAPAFAEYLVGLGLPPNVRSP